MFANRAYSWKILSREGFVDNCHSCRKRSVARVEDASVQEWNAERSKVIGTHAASARARVPRATIGMTFRLHEIAKSESHEIDPRRDRRVARARDRRGALDRFLIEVHTPLPGIVPIRHQIQRKENHVFGANARPHRAHAEKTLRQ